MIEIEEHHPLVLLIDEIEGTTNTKRCSASLFDYRPQALISMALLSGNPLSNLVVSAVFTLDQEEIFSSLKVENGYLAFHNQTIIDPSKIMTTYGDSKTRILVTGYSNSHRIEKGKVEQAFYDLGYRVYDGCRSSGMDIIGIIRNSADAYVDLRHFWSTKTESGQEKEAMLQVYDVAGVIPIAAGCGLTVTDCFGKSWEEYGVDDTIPLVLSRPNIHGKILEAIKPLVEKSTTI